MFKSLQQQLNQKQQIEKNKKEIESNLTDFINQADIFYIIAESIHNEFSVNETTTNTNTNQYKARLLPFASEQYGDVDQYELYISDNQNGLKTLVKADITLTKSNNSKVLKFEFVEFEHELITIDEIKEIIKFVVGV